MQVTISPRSFSASRTAATSNSRCNVDLTPISMLSKSMNTASLSLSSIYFLLRRSTLELPGGNRVSRLAGMLPLHKIRIWPLGFYDFLERLLTANPYAGTFTNLELLDEVAVVEGIERALYDSGTRDRLAVARADYLTILDTEVDTRKAFTEAASHVGLTL